MVTLIAKYPNAFNVHHEPRHGGEVFRVHYHGWNDHLFYVMEATDYDTLREHLLANPPYRHKVLRIAREINIIFVEVKAV